MRFQKTLLAGAVALALSPQLFAQDSEAAQQTAQTAQPRQQDKQQDAQGGSTAQRLAPLVVESSIQRDAVVNLLDTGELGRRQVDDFEDMVRLLPGVSVSRGDDRWGASGFNIRGLDEDRVAMNVDGVPQGETIRYETGQPYGYFKGNRNGTEIETLKAVEIVKGADSILSGSGSLAGAVNMTTKDPDDYLAASGDDTGGDFKTRYSSANDQAMASIAFANRFGRLESLLIYTRRDGHEFESYDMDALDVAGPAREIPDPQKTEVDNVLAKLVYEFRPGHEIGVNASYHDQTRFSDMQSFNGGWYANRVGNDYTTTERFGITHEYVGSTFLFDRIASAINHQEVAFEANTTQHVDIPPATNEERTDTRSFDQELLQVTVDLDKTIDVGTLQHNLSYGIEMQDKEFLNRQTRRANSALNTRGWVTTNIGALVPTAEADIVTLYALDTFDAGPSTQLRIGARYDDYTYDASTTADFNDRTGTLQEVTFSTATWTLGVEQALTDTLRLEAGVSTGFRAPTIEDMYSTSGTVDNWGTVANPDLEAEYSTNYDLALAGQFAEAGTWRAGVFYSRYEDFIDYVPTTGINTSTGLPDLNGWNVPTNFNEVDMRGVELSAFVDLDAVFGWRGVTTNVQAAWTDGENANGDPVYTVQPFKLTWALDYTAPQWGASLYTTHTSGKENSDAYRTDPLLGRVYPVYLSNTATVFDLTAYYDIGGARLSLSVNNLADKEYYNWDAVRFVDQGDLRPGNTIAGNGIRRYSEPGRNYEAALAYRF